VQGRREDVPRSQDNRIKGAFIDSRIVASEPPDIGYDQFMKSVVVLLPVHNEAWLIGSVLGQVLDFARSHEDWRFVFVDDGSSDGTPEAIEKRLEETRSHRIELLALTPNRGKALALREAVLGTSEDLVLFTDGDLAYPLEHLEALAAELEHADVAIGSRALSRVRQSNISMLRRFSGTAFNIAVRLITTLPFDDTQAGLKGFRRDAARVLFRAQRVRDFAFDAELLYLAKVLQLRVVEIPANVSARHSYKKSRVNMLRDPLRMFWSLIRMRFTHRRLRPREASDPVPGDPLVRDRTAEFEIEVEADLDQVIECRASSRKRAGVGAE